MEPSKLDFWIPRDRIVWVAHNLSLNIRFVENIRFSYLNGKKESFFFLKQKRNSKHRFFSFEAIRVLINFNLLRKNKKIIRVRFRFLIDLKKTQQCLRILIIKTFQIV